MWVPLRAEFVGFSRQARHAARLGRAHRWVSTDRSNGFHLPIFVCAPWQRVAKSIATKSSESPTPMELVSAARGEVTAQAAQNNHKHVSTGCWRTYDVSRLVRPVWSEYSRVGRSIQCDSSPEQRVGGRYLDSALLFGAKHNQALPRALHEAVPCLEHTASTTASVPAAAPDALEAAGLLAISQRVSPPAPALKPEPLAAAPAPPAHAATALGDAAVPSG